MLHLGSDGENSLHIFLSSFTIIGEALSPKGTSRCMYVQRHLIIISSLTRIIQRTSW